MSKELDQPSSASSREASSPSGSPSSTSEAFLDEVSNWSKSMPVLSSVEALDVGDDDDDVVLSSVVALLMELPPMSLLYKSSPKDLESWPESEAEAKSSARSCASSSGVFSPSVVLLHLLFLFLLRYFLRQQHW